MCRPYHVHDPEQPYLLPPSPREWLPKNHLVYFIHEAIDRLDLSVFHAYYEKEHRGAVPYHPALMLKVLIYAYALGIFSSRAIAQAMQTRLDFIFLVGKTHPSHRTICRFRQRHLQDFLDISEQVVALDELEDALYGDASGWDLTSPSVRTALEETTDAQQASPEAPTPSDRASNPDKETGPSPNTSVQGMEGADRASDTECERLDPEPPDPASPEVEAPHSAVSDLEEEVEQKIADTEQKIEQLSHVKTQLEQRSGKTPPSPKATYNRTDPDSRIMKTSHEGFQQGFNAQVAVDVESQIIVHAHVTQQANDRQQLIPMLEGVKAACGSLPDRVLADAGYVSEANLAALEEQGIDGYVAVGKKGAKRGAVNADRLPATARMQAKLLHPEGQARYGKRKEVVEPSFGWIKHGMSFRQFSVRGLAQVRGEWDLVCSALNLRRMAGMIQS